jgi:hypothetical protein
MLFLSTQNKEILWSVLQENNIFDNIPNNEFSNVQKTFENILENYASQNEIDENDIMKVNKEVIPILLTEINSITNKKIASFKEPSKKIEVVYKSEDLKKNRMEEVQMKLKKQEDDMKTLLHPPKPKEVSFADNNTLDDKPIGGDMDRLVKEMLANRERELDTINTNDESRELAKQWISENDTEHREESIKEHREESIKEPKKLQLQLPDDIITPDVVPNQKDVITNKTNDIFTKLKKKTVPNPYDIILTRIDEIQSVQKNIMEKLTALEEKINIA